MLYTYQYGTGILLTILILMFFMIYWLCSPSRCLNKIIKDNVKLEREVINRKNTLFYGFSKYQYHIKGNEVDEDLFKWEYCHNITAVNKNRGVEIMTSEQYYKLWG